MQDVWDKATVEGQAYRMDVLWHYLLSLRAADNSFRFPRFTSGINNTSFQCSRRKAVFHGSEE